MGFELRKIDGIKKPWTDEEIEETREMCLSFLNSQLERMRVDNPKLELVDLRVIDVRFSEHMQEFRPQYWLNLKRARLTYLYSSMMYWKLQNAIESYKKSYPEHEAVHLAEREYLYLKEEEGWGEDEKENWSLKNGEHFLSEGEFKKLHCLHPGQTFTFGGNRYRYSVKGETWFVAVRLLEPEEYQYLDPEDYGLMASTVDPRYELCEDFYLESES